MRVLVAPDAFKGTLTAAAAAAAIADGWSRARPDDTIRLLPLSDGGEGVSEVLSRPGDEWLDVEVVGPLARPVDTRLLVRADGLAVVESAAACGLHLVPPQRRDPLTTTSFGVGQLVRAALDVGAQRVLVGLGGSATVDAGLGALTGLGFRLRVADGSGLKIGGGEVHRLDRVERGWAPAVGGVAVELLADVTTTLPDAARVFGPQKGADEAAVEYLTDALLHAADVLERDLAAGRRLRDLPGSGAAGGLGLALAAALGAPLTPGAARVGELLRLPDAVAEADVVVTGEGRLDATSSAGKVVGHVLDLATKGSPRPVLAVAGQVDVAGPTGLAGAEAAAPGGPGPDPAGEVAAAAARLAATFPGP